jgi:hypothetical protein
MARVPDQKRIAQLALFQDLLRECKTELPRWQDLAEATRGEAITLLAMLLGDVQATRQALTIDGLRGRDE